MIILVQTTDIVFLDSFWADIRNPSGASCTGTGPQCASALSPIVSSDVRAAGGFAAYPQ